MALLIPVARALCSYLHTCLLSYKVTLSIDAGREVAVYCATHLADIIKSSEAYSQGDLKQAMKDAFMKCDRLVTEREAIEEMKTYDEDEMKEE